jgi:hypothetical protein
MEANMDSPNTQIRNFSESVNTSWKRHLRSRSSFSRIAFSIFLGAVILVAVYGRQRILLYSMLLIAITTVTLLGEWWIRRSKK